MVILAAVLLIVAALLLLGGGIWLVVEAFQESIAWGLCVLLVPVANIVFMFARWQRARGPFLCQFIGLMLVGGAYSVVSGFERKGGKMPDLSQLPVLKKVMGASASPSPAPKSGVMDSGMFKAQKDAELQIKLVSLHTRETELLQRKSELAPGDRAGAAKLAEEIKKYNVDLQPVLQQLKENQAPK